ncbi:MAG: ribosome recycling factor [Clostridium sp.]|nr:ribosome recycling factor [Clostridium sp.]
MMDFNSIEEKMKKTISVFEESLSEVRAGRANPNILNKITVDYYGVATPINQIAGISVPEPRMILIQPWDISMLKEIEKAINIAEIGINPNNDGKVIRLAFPELTEERRKDLVKDIRKIAEESKVAIRAIRRDGMDMAKTAQKNNEMTQDDLTAAETKIQKMTDTKIAEIDELLAKKEKEIMTV